MTTYQIHIAIRNLAVDCYEFGADLPIKVTYTTSFNGTTVTGCSGTLYNQLKNRAGEIRAVLMDNVDEFENDCGVTVIYNASGYPAPAAPLPPQDPVGPPIIIPPLPPTTPPTSNDYIYVV